MKTQNKTVLISVSDKTNVVEFARFLSSQNYKILSTGGTAKLLAEAGIKITKVSDHTGFPEIMDGRVKTLHPKIHGGLLADRDNSNHVDAMQQNSIEGIDILVINLYPFEQTLQKTDDFNTIIENIDIGGPAMTRAAAKNHKHVAVVTNPADYADIQAEIEANGDISPDTRLGLAHKAFNHTAHYDAIISNWFYTQTGADTKYINLTAEHKQTLRYGENPHQQAWFYNMQGASDSLANAQQLQGKELSYNNINDTDTALSIVTEFDKPCVAIIKHANPCGVAVADNLTTAYKQAFACDTVSAFGGIIALNGNIDANTAQEITKIFSEVVIAPSIDEDAKAIFAKKKNLRLLITGQFNNNAKPQIDVKAVSGGLLVQTSDDATLSADELNIVTDVKLSEQQVADILFGFKVTKYVKSNAIVLVKDNTTIGIGAGQSNRVGSVKIAATQAGEQARGATLISDAFFPFADNVELASEYGIAAILQPGGSIRDDEVIASANKHNIAMAFCGKRTFRH